MTVQILLLNINAIVCFLIAIRIFTFRRGESRHSWAGSIFAYILMISCFAITIRIVTGEYHKADWAETMINLALCISLYQSRGNVMHIFRKRVPHANQR